MRWLEVVGIGVSLALAVAVGCSSSSKSGDNQGGGGSAAAGNQGGGAGESSTGSTNGSGGYDGPPIECGTPGATCAQGQDCCSGLCAEATEGQGGAGGNESAGVCVRNPNECLTGGFACSSNLDCCTGNCADGFCSDNACLEDGAECSAGGDACCGGECIDGTCADVNGDRTCKVSGNSCESDGQCCSKLCLQGKCYAKSSYCTQGSDTCTADTDCCEGVCDKTFGNTYGFCARPTSTGTTGCNAGELLAGQVCDGDCSKCCSRSCAPNHLGVFVCQLSGGCRPSGEICTKAEDCCGGTNVEDLPGAYSGSPATCVKRSPEDVFGQCRQSGGCTPRGDTCKYDSTDGSSCTANALKTKPSNCCTLGNTDPHGICTVDALYVPRCGSTGECRAAGQTCASSADCCEQRPCVPDAEGVLRCGANECVNESGSCTVDADCCVGTLCVIPPGAVTGTCGKSTPPPPPGSGGSTGSGGNSGSGGSSSGGATGTGGSGSGECIPYGQNCTESSECCNADTGVFCSGRCVIVR